MSSKKKQAKAPEPEQIAVPGFAEMRKAIHDHMNGTLSIPSFLMRPPDLRPVAEQRRIGCLDRAIQVYSLNQGGISANGQMEPEGVVGLAREMERFVNGD